MTRGFWARRLARESPTGLGLTLGVLLAAITFGAFVVLAVAVEEQTALVELDHELASRLHEEALSSDKTRLAFRVITETGSVAGLTVLTALIALILCRRRDYVLAVCVVAGITGGGLIDYHLKAHFQRPRPEFPDPIIVEPSTSFPSGHSVGSLVAYGFLAYVLMHRRPAGWQRLAVAAFLAVWVLAIGFSRMYLGAHYLSDVLGGFSAGACWLAIVITALEVIRRQRQARAAPASHPPDNPAGSEG